MIDDRGDWSELYSALYPRMVRLAGLLLCDFHLGEEIAQDAFARLIEAQRSVADPEPYLRATVANLCRSRIRRAVVARRLSGLISVNRREITQESIPDRLLVRQALGRLPARQREAAVLRLYAGLSEAEAAAAMGVSTGTVKTHLHRAVAALAASLKVEEP